MSAFVFVMCWVFLCIIYILDPKFFWQIIGAIVSGELLAVIVP